MDNLKDFIKNDPDYLSYMSGEVYDPNEEFHGEHFVYWLYVKFFRFCGCNQGTDRLYFIHTILKLINDRMNKVISLSEYRITTEQMLRARGLYDFVFDYLNNLHLITHGGSNVSCWLTDDGLLVLDNLDKWIKKDKALNFEE